MKKLVLCFALVFGGVISGNYMAPVDAGGSRFAPIASRMMQSTCEVHIDGSQHGSGVRVDSKGLIATARHVVDSAGPESITVVFHNAKFNDSFELDAHLVAVDRNHDIALLQCNVNSKYFARLNTDKRIAWGTPITCIGCPADIPMVPTRGYYVGSHPDDPQLSTTVHVAVSSFYGNSGGPIFDSNTEKLVGITIGMCIEYNKLSLMEPAWAIDKLMKKHRKITK